MKFMLILSIYGTELYVSLNLEDKCCIRSFLVQCNMKV